jgi:hypothetical protein
MDSMPMIGSDSDDSVRSVSVTIIIDYLYMLIFQRSRLQMNEPIEPYVRKRNSTTNRPSSSSSSSAKSRLLLLDDDDQHVVRENINSRERRRMHDLNDALDDLRKVLPQSEVSDGTRSIGENLMKHDHATVIFRVLFRQQEN